MTTTIEIQIGQIWNFGAGFVLHVDSFDDDGKVNLGRAYRNTFAKGGFILIEPEFKYDADDFDGANLVQQA